MLSQDFRIVISILGILGLYQPLTCDHNLSWIEGTYSFIRLWCLDIDSFDSNRFY